MGMTGLLILAKHVHDSKDILHKHIVPGVEIGRESPALSVPSLIGGWVPQRSVSSQRHESPFRMSQPPGARLRRFPTILSPATRFPRGSVSAALNSGAGRTGFDTRFRLGPHSRTGSQVLS